MESITDYKTFLNSYSKISRELDETAHMLRTLIGDAGRSKPFDYSGYKNQPPMSLRRNSPSGKYKNQLAVPLRRLVLEQTSGKYKNQLAVPLRRPVFEQTSGKWDNLSNSSELEESTSEDEPPSKRVALQSAVIEKVEHRKTRRELISTQNCNIKLQSRNRRILGVLQSTLKKFQDEEIKRQPQNLKRKRALEKVEAAVQEEKNSVWRQKEELFLKARKQKLQLECLEKMMKIAESFALWENNQKHLLNFILTKTEPHIFFLPATLTSVSEKHLKRSKVEIKEKIAEQRAFVESILYKISLSCDLPIPVCTKETSLTPKVDYSEEFSRQYTETVNKQKYQEEETLSLFLNEEESELLRRMLLNEHVVL